MILIIRFEVSIIFFVSFIYSIRLIQGFLRILVAWPRPRIMALGAIEVA